MERERGPAAALAIVLLLGGASRCQMAPVGRASLPTICETGWAEVESDRAGTTAVACASPDSRSSPPVGPVRLLIGLPIELNLASPSTLEVLPGIGPERARAIVLERCRAPFERLADVSRVRGIGPKTMEALRAQATAGPPTPNCSTTPTLPP